MLGFLYTYRYSPLPLGSDIRLLRLKPDEDEIAPIQCELFNYSLQKSTKGTHLYEALSYVWGDPKETLPIRVDGDQFPVTVKLHEALLRLRDRSIERIIWVDAVCIDQENSQEKEHQIQLMAKIYGQANRVIIWLGEAADDSDRAVEEIRVAGGKKSTNSSNETIQRAIRALLGRVWFRRIWVLQEVAAARHVLVMCGSAEIDGYAFCLGVDLLEHYYEARPDLQSLIRSVTYLIKGAIFRPKYATTRSGRSSLDICPLGELIDRYHTHEATKRHDKLYALLGMTSDDLSKANLLPDYGVLWEDLLQRLAKFLLGEKVSVETWPDTETAVIKGKGRVLGKVSLAKSGIAGEDRQDVDIIFKNTLAQPGYMKEWSAHWTLHVSAKSILDNDLVCLLEGASKPTIIRRCKDHFAVIVIAATPTMEIPTGSGHVKWTELLRSITTFPRDFLLIWDWKKCPERWRDRDYESLIEITSQVPNYSKTKLEGYLDKATRVWNVALILKDSEMDDEAGKALDLILEESSTSITAPEKHFDKIYITVLGHSIHANYTNEEREELCSTLKHILGSVVVLSSQLSAYSLSKLLHITKQEVDQTLEDLHTILDIPEDQTRPLRLHHPSFRNFLLGKDRCTNSKFWVDEKQAHRVLAESCIQLMSTFLKQDICGLGAPGVLVTDIESRQVEQCLPSEVQYACLHWVQHLQKSSMQLYDDDKIHQFLQTHLLHWLEALSWMRSISEGILAIVSLESITLTGDFPRLYPFVRDIKRFAVYSRSTVEQVPLQIYSSALVFAPANSIVRNQFKDKIPRRIQRLPNVQKDWSTLLQTLEGHSSSVKAVAFSLDGKQLASASYRGVVRLWDPATGAALQTLEGHSSSVNALAFSPDGKQLVSVSYDNTVRLWDTATGAAIQTHKCSLRWANTVAFSPDSKQLTSNDTINDTIIRLWDTATGAALQTLEGHSSWVMAVAFSPDGKQLASVASYSKTVRLWDTARGTALQALEGHSCPVNAVAFSPDGKQLASVSDDKTVRLWDTATRTALQALQTFKGHSEEVKAVAFSLDGKQLASASNDKTVRLWNTATGAALQTLEGHWREVKAVAFSPDGKQLASASDDKTVRLWNTATGAALQTFEGHSGPVNTVGFSPDSKQLASASDDNTVKLWDTATGAALQTLEGHSEEVKAVAFSLDGKQLASASHDKTVRLWGVATGVMLQALQTLEGHSDSVNAVAFLPDGKQLVSASDDKTVRLWDTATGAALQTLEFDAVVLALPFSSSGSCLETDRTLLDLVSLCPSIVPSRRTLSRGVFVKEQWIAQGIENLLWLPWDYRPSSAAVQGSVVILGHACGRVSILECAL